MCVRVYSKGVVHPFHSSGSPGKSKEASIFSVMINLRNFEGFAFSSGNYNDM